MSEAQHTAQEGGRTAGPANRLAGETSPYLLQHAHNPVDWYPWGDEALQSAQREQRPILLSVGYSACHWCHVMERESFESRDIAELMNRSFVCIKVDREERPDIDAIYMEAVQMLTGQGGWPMTVFLTPQGKPFYAGTYFPPEDRFGVPGFPRILIAVAEAWEQRRGEVEAQAAELTSALQQASGLQSGMSRESAGPHVVESALAELSRSFDARHGGFGSAPKFPQPSVLALLLRASAGQHNGAAAGMGLRTLDAMADGGIHDHLGGGFHRYSTDRIWLVPHFEKMLYDNAQLAQVYLRASKLCAGRARETERYAGIALSTLRYMLRELRSPDGGFYSAEDADSEGEEGRFYVWSAAEIRELLPAEDAGLLCAAYGVTDAGNWDGRSILNTITPVDLSGFSGQTAAGDVSERLLRAREMLLEARSRRPRPGRDDKILVGWNGLAIAALAECGRVFGGEFVRPAQQAASFVLDRLSYRDASGRLRLRRSWRGRASGMGYLEDYALLADGLVWLYQADFDPKWLLAAGELIDALDASFWSDKAGGYYSTADDAEQLIQRPISWDDNAVPGGNSVAADVLLRLFRLMGRDELADRAERILESASPLMLRYPQGFGRMLSVLDSLHADPLELAIVGPIDHETTHRFLDAAARSPHPDLLTAWWSGEGEAPQGIELLSGRPMQGGRPAAYLCRGSVCGTPITEPPALEEALRG